MNRKLIQKLVVIISWLCIWQLVSWLAGLELIIASPVKTLISLVDLIYLPEFYEIILHSFLKITVGFLSAFIIGMIIAGTAFCFPAFKAFIEPLVYLMKALPVVSFIVLLLIWIGSVNLSVFISFLIVFPMIYLGTLEGLKNTDARLKEMAQVFRIKLFRKIRYLYMPQVFSYIEANIKTALGMCWKAGISAEVIGLPVKSIGEQLYLSKLYLMTDRLLAWSIVIVLISFCFERFFLFLLSAIIRRLES